MKRQLSATSPYSQEMRIAKKVRSSKLKRSRKWRRRQPVSARALVPRILKDPFPPEWRTKLTWAPSTYLMAPGTTNGCLVIRVNDIYDPDVSNVLGNDQPLYTDQILSATGPYQLFHVNSWKAKITLCNVSGSGGGSSGDLALDGYVIQGGTSSTDVDTFAEDQFSAGRQTFMLGPKTASGNMKTIYFNGSQRAYTPASKDIDACGTYGASPSKPIFLSVGLKNAFTTDTGTIQCYIKVVVEYDVTFMHRDGIQS